MRNRTREFFKTVPERFGALHFYGKGSASFFPELFETAVEFTKAPWDFMELRRHRMVIGYMPSGCLDGARQSDIRRISGDVCARCMWEHDPVVCSDARNAAWGRRVESLCDWIGIEGDWGVGERTGDRYVRQAVVTTLDPEMWRPKLDIPEDMRIEKSPGELVIYHGVGNDRIRREGARDIKGTGAVLAAVEKLREEGHAVRIVFATDIHSARVRFLQAQADIVVDQLNYGRYGANARECLMLGLPVVGYLDARQDAPLPPARQIEECPIVQADIHSVQNVLRGLILDSRAREKAAKAGRKFAVKWHGAMACAERYEKVIDRVRAGLAPDSPDLYPSP